MTAFPALVYELETAALADIATIDAHKGYPNAGATTWAAPMKRWDGKWWIADPQDAAIVGLTGTPDPDANAWPEVP